MKVGEIEVIPVSDGELKMPPQYFPNADWSVHRDLLNEEELLVLSLGCFVVRTGGQTVLVDSGIGPVESPFVKGGELPARLEASGVKPSDVDIVLLTHLHNDHIGWMVRDERPFFDASKVKVGKADWEHFVEKGDPADFARQSMEVLAADGRIELIEGDSAIAPGITSLHAPGHTPGHMCVVVSSGTDRVLLLGDAVMCPIQIEETEWQAMGDVDPDLARRTRESLSRELETDGGIAVGSHFPGLRFGRVLTGQGKRYFA